MTDFAHRLDRTLVIYARPDTVFQFFTEPAQWAAWWGSGSTIDARPGGRMLIRHPNGVEVTGEVLAVDTPQRIVFTYGFASGKPIPPGASRVTIVLGGHAQGTLLQLTHEFDDERARDEHVQGWRFQLSLFANLIADTAADNTAAVVDQWFATWSQPDAAVRDSSLDAIAAPSIHFADKYSCIHGIDEVRAHLAAVHRFMPGMRLERRGAIRHCQWCVLADWVAVNAKGEERGAGTNVFAVDAQRQITSVTGFWNG